MAGMNVKKVVFYVLDVGQGACNYVEIINTSDVVVHNMLVDIGTNSSQAIAAANLEWLKNKIQNRPNPKIDVVLLTHGDNDHYNMMLKLLPALGLPTQQQIGMVRYGGVDWRYKIGKTALIAELRKYCADVHGFAPQASCYQASPGSWNRLWPSNAVFQPGDASLYVLMANTPHPQDGTIKQGARRPNAEAINSKSLVFAVYWNANWFIGTGDGTAETLAHVNGHFNNVTMWPTMSLTLPHHGSRKTTYNLGNASDLPGAPAIKVVDDFLKLFKPWTISVSADEKRHHHPSLKMINQFSKATQTNVKYWSDPTLVAGNHYLTPWVDEHISKRGVVDWPGQWIYATTQTTANVYPTLYYDARVVVDYLSPPIPAHTPAKPVIPSTAKVPRGRNWAYTSNGSALAVESVANVRAASTARMVFIGRVAASPPARPAGQRAPAIARGGLPIRASQYTVTNMTMPPRLAPPAPPAPIARAAVAARSIATGSPRPRLRAIRA